MGLCLYIILNLSTDELLGNAAHACFLPFFNIAAIFGHFCFYLEFAICSKHTTMAIWEIRFDSLGALLLKGKKKGIGKEKQTYRQTEVETKRQTNEPIVRETNGQTDKHSERETNRHTYKERERERQIERRTKYSKKVPTYGTWNYVNRDLYNMSSELFCFES